MDILFDGAESVGKFPEDWVFLESGISGGTYADYLTWAVSKFGDRLALQLLPIRHRFTLPCYDGQGEILDEAQLTALLDEHLCAFSSLLCCNWCYLPTEEIILWDDRNSLLERLRMAAAAGVARVVIDTAIQKKFRLPGAGSPISVI